MTESKPESLGRGSPELLELMVDVALVFPEFLSELPGAIAKL